MPSLLMDYSVDFNFNNVFSLWNATRPYLLILDIISSSCYQLFVLLPVDPPKLNMMCYSILRTPRIINYNIIIIITVNFLHYFDAGGVETRSTGTNENMYKCSVCPWYQPVTIPLCYRDLRRLFCVIMPLFMPQQNCFWYEQYAAPYRVVIV